MTNTTRTDLVSLLAEPSALTTAGLPHSNFAGPLYMQVANILRSKICADEWTPRAPLPNEVVLARDIGVSIGTMRKALEVLEDEHLVERRQGRGTFVVESSVETELERFSNVVLAGRKVRANAVKWTVTQGATSAEEARALFLRDGAEVFRLEAVWKADAVTCVERITVSAARFPALPEHLAEGGQFLFPIYRRHYHEPIAKVVECVSAVHATDRDAHLLDVDPGAPVLHVCRIAYALSGPAVEWSRRTMHLGDADYVVRMT